jgi:PAS domain S-box-containing protein
MRDNVITEPLRLPDDLTGSRFGGAPNAGATILNVDDNEIGRYAKSRALHEAGFNVLEAGTGMEALRLVREVAPDIVLLDVQLPDINGIDVCRIIKSDEQTLAIPVLHLSATCVDPRTQARGLENADGYLVEPVEPLVLVATINALLRARRAEDKMRASQRALDELFESAPVGLRIVDADGRIIRANHAEVRLLGESSPADLVGHHVSDFHASRVQVEEALAKLRAGEPIDDWECELIARGGTRRHVVISANGYFQRGTLVHSRWFVRDITDRSLADAQIRRQTQALARSNADLEDFAYIASHDLKEPLRGIQNYARFVIEDHGETLPGEARNMLESIQRLSQRMESLMSALLEYSRVGRTEMAMGDINLNEVVNQALETLQNLIEESGAKVRIVSPLPVIHCDRVRIVEIFRNLIANGIKYNRSQPPVVEIGALEAEQVPASVRPENGQVAIYFKDNGIGIPERHWGNIFRMFKRLHGRDEFGGGTGTGLAIVHKLVERHGGRVDVRSSPGEGSTFYITL